MSKVLNAFLDFIYGFTGRFPSTVEIMPQLCLAHACDPLKTSKAECFAVFLKKTGGIIEKLIFNFFKVFSMTLIVLPHSSVRCFEIIDSFFYRLSFANDAVR